jgi:hypothetical protein
LGASATQTLRTPFALNTQATRLLCRAAINSEGKGELITCWSVKPAHRVEVKQAANKEVSNRLRRQLSRVLHISASDYDKRFAFAKW